MEYGKISSRKDQAFTVQTQNGCYTAHRAKSCLLAPEEGDTVLCCTDDLGACFILAVLEGRQDAGVLEFQGDLDVQVNDGSLRLSSDQELSLTSDALRFTARAGSLAMERFSLLTETVSAQCRTLSLAADACQQSLRSLTQRLGSFFRATEGHEETQAASSRQLVEDTRVVHCKNSVLMAEEDARIDAEQIQLG